MSFLEGFNLGKVVAIEIRSYTVGPGQSAQLTAVTIEVWRRDAHEPEIVELDYGGGGPSLAAVQVAVRVINRRLQERRDEGP